MKDSRRPFRCCFSYSYIFTKERESMMNERKKEKRIKKLALDFFGILFIYKSIVFSAFVAVVVYDMRCAPISFS